MLKEMESLEGKDENKDENKDEIKAGQVESDEENGSDFIEELRTSDEIYLFHSKMEL